MEPLRDALQINYFGVLRVQDLAKECKNLICMVHVSSTFVNSNQPPYEPRVKEQLYKQKIDCEPDEFINRLASMNPQALETETPKILDQLGFPNTYTFSKNMAEQVIVKRRGNMRLSILRPSAIKACAREPFPGWMD